MRYAPLKGHSEPITGLAFSPDGKILASASYDKTVILWNVATGEPDGTLLDDAAIIDVAINKDGTVLASAREDGVVTLWNLKSRDKTSLPRGSPSSALAFSPKDAALLASGGRDGRIVLWDTRTRKQAPKPIEVGTAVFSMAFSHDGKTIASGNLYGSVNAWNVATRAPLPPGKYLNRPGTRSVVGIAFSPDDRRLASVSSLDRTVYIHHLDQRDREPRRLNGYIKPFPSVDFIDNDTLATGTVNGMVVIWDLNNNCPFEYPMIPKNTKATSADFVDDGKTLISHWGMQLQFWPINKLSSIPSVTVRRQPEIRLSLRAPNGEHLVTIGTDNSIALWDVAKRSELSMLVPRRDATAISSRPRSAPTVEPSLSRYARTRTARKARFG
jgi:WD40 repeat protein